MTRILAALIVMSVVNSSIAQTYTILDLGPAGSEFSAARAINKHNHVVGQSGNIAFFYDGDLAGIPLLGGQLTVAYGLNQKDRVVGHIVEGGRRAFTYHNGVTSYLFPEEVTVRTQAHAINDKNIIVGIYGQRAYIYDFKEDELELLDEQFSFSEAVAINKHNEVVGNFRGSDGKYRGFLFDYDTKEFTDLNYFGGAYSSAQDINDRGQIVIVKVPVPGTHEAFIYDSASGEITAIPSPTGFGCVPEAINNRGQVVGTLRPNGADWQNAFIWDGGEVQELDPLINDSEWNLFRARDINDKGHIVGVGEFPADGEQHAFMLIPTPKRDARGAMGD